MGRKSSSIKLTNVDREYLELQTRARTIQAQTANRARIILLKAEGESIDAIADKVGMNRKSSCFALTSSKRAALKMLFLMHPDVAGMLKSRMKKKHGL